MFPLNKNMFRHVFLLFVVLFCSNWSSNSQTILVDDTSYNPSQLAKLLVANSCTQISNTSISSNKSVAYFDKNNANFPISDGIIIRNGIATYSQGSFTDTNLSSQVSENGDADLQKISNDSGQNSIITDVAYLEFDFTSPSSNFNFNFLFASNEYGEFQCGFSDSFAFLLTDLTTNTTTNLAVIPNTETPISVKNIRDTQYNTSCSSTNPHLFGALNSIGDATALNMRGYTVMMNASADIIPNRSYRIKLVIGDYNDSDYDSAIFLSAGNFIAPSIDLGEDTAICDKTLVDTGLNNSLYSHTWKKDGVQITGENNSSLTINSPGTYDVTATNTNGCVLTDQIVIEDIQINPPVDLFSCDLSGATTYNLTLNDENALGIDPAKYEVNYYASLADISNNITIQKSQAQNYQSQGNQTIYLKLKNKITNKLCTIISSFTLKFVTIIATKPNDIEICDINESINIPTIVESQILNGQNPNNLFCTYFTSLSNAENNANPITTPNEYTITNSNSTKIWVRMNNVMNDNCFDIVDFSIITRPAPQIDEIENVIECNSYILPIISNGNYYTEPNGNGDLLQAGEIIEKTSTYYIYNKNSYGCSNESSFSVTIVEKYSIPLEYCGELIIPSLSFGKFFTAPNGPNGNGTEIQSGTAINSSQTIYFYSSKNGILCVEKAFPITIFPIPEIDKPSHVLTCESYTLPALTNGNYNTRHNGLGTVLYAGDVITSSQNLYVFSDNGNCINQSPFSVTIVKDDFEDITACSTYTLPSLVYANYYTKPFGDGSLIPQGTTLTTSQTVYVYVNDSCTNTMSFDVIILSPPNVDELNDFTRCINDPLELPVLTDGEYFTESNRLGTQLYPGAIIYNSQTIYINSKGSLCSNESSFEVDIRPIPLVDNLSNITSCDSYVLPELTNGEYYTESGGNGTQLNAGDNISSKQKIYIYNNYSDLNACTSETFFTVDILGINVDAPTDVIACDSYELPELTEGNYFTEAKGNGTLLNAGDIITTNQKIYVYGQNGKRFFCDDENEFTVTITTSPSLPVFPDIEKCGSYTLPSFRLTGTSVSFYRKPNREDKIENSAYTFDEPGTYTVYISATSLDNPNCTDEKQFQITINPLLDLYIDGGIVCVNADTGKTTKSTVLSSGLDSLTYKVNWYFEGVLMGTGSNFTADKEGTYTVQTTKLTPDIGTDCNYNPTQVEVIASSPKPEIVFISDAFSENTSIRVDFIEEGLGSYEYQLDNGEFQSSNEFTNINRGIHTVTIRDITLCGDSTIQFTALDHPKFFSPNNDGKNETWNIPHIKDQASAVIYIYDRYGILMSKISPGGEGWDGFYNGKPLPSSDYWFKVHLSFNGIPTMFQGSFSLLR